LNSTYHLAPKLYAKTRMHFGAVDIQAPPRSVKFILERNAACSKLQCCTSEAAQLRQMRTKQGTSLINIDRVHVYAAPFDIACAIRFLITKRRASTAYISQTGESQLCINGVFIFVTAIQWLQRFRKGYVDQLSWRVFDISQPIAG
jgi:hypothetical protein